MLRQRRKRAVIRRIVRVNRIVGQLRANKLVFALVLIAVVDLRPLESRRRLMVNPQRLHPRMPDVAGVASSSHGRETARNGATVARSKKLPLLQGEMRQFIEPDEQELGALILVNVIFIAAVTKARCRSSVPGDDMLRLVVTPIQRARDVATKISEQRRFQLRICTP